NFGDFNGDGRLDYLRIYYDWYNYVFDVQLASSTPGTFTSLTRVFVPATSPSGYATPFSADINGDGRMDIVEPPRYNGSEANFGYWRSNGDGTFANRVVVNISGSAPHAAYSSWMAGDFNGD